MSTAGASSSSREENSAHTPINRPRREALTEKFRVETQLNAFTQANLEFDEKNAHRARIQELAKIVDDIPAQAWRTPQHN